MNIKQTRVINDYKGLSYYLAEFRSKLGFSRDFAGKNVHVSTADGLAYNIYFPIIQEEDDANGYSTLVSPFSPDFLNAGLDDWGSINSYRPGEHPPYREIRVGAVVVESESKERSRIRKSVERLWASLIALHPEAVKEDSKDDINACLCSFNQVGDNIVLDVSICAYPDDIHISVNDFLLAKANINNDLTIQYDLLSKAHRYGVLGDFRNALLNYATIIDVTLRQTITHVIKTDGTYDAEAEEAVNNAHGYRDFKRLLALTKTPIFKNAGIDNIMKKRNRVIHEGEHVTLDDINGMLDTIINLLMFYNIPFFIGQVKYDEEELSSWATPLISAYE